MSPTKFGCRFIMLARCRLFLCGSMQAFYFPFFFEALMPSYTVERTVSIRHKEISFQIFQNKMRPFIFISTFCWMVYEHHCVDMDMDVHRGEGTASNKIKIHETRFECLEYLLTHHIPRVPARRTANVRRKHYTEALVLMVDSQIATKCSCYCLDFSWIAL